MQRRKSRKPKADEMADVNGKHLYRVVVERVLTKPMLILAESQDAAEVKAYALASENLSVLQWTAEDMRVRNRTLVKLADGSWKSCNVLDADPGVMVQYAPESPSRAGKETK